jgi:hypothetical protein
MASIIDTVTQQLGGDTLQRISQQIGADPAATERAIGVALPTLVGGLARNAQQPAGAQALSTALNDHSSTLDQLGAIVADPNSGPGAGILGHIFGQQRAPVEQGVSKAAGLDAHQIGKLMMILAPIVMSVLARRGKQADAPPVTDVLSHESQQMEKRSPGLGGLLGGLLDGNHDGQIIDDLGRLAKGGLGGLGGR